MCLMNVAHVHVHVPDECLIYAWMAGQPLPRAAARVPCRALDACLLPPRVRRVRPLLLRQLVAPAMSIHYVLINSICS